MMYTDGLALVDRAESVRVTVASAVYEFATSTKARIVIEFAETASALAGIDGNVAQIWY